MTDISDPTVWLSSLPQEMLQESFSIILFSSLISPFIASRGLTEKPFIASQGRKDGRKSPSSPPKEGRTDGKALHRLPRTDGRTDRKALHRLPLMGDLSDPSPGSAGFLEETQQVFPDEQEFSWIIGFRTSSPPNDG